jgi:hypothetical protein
MHTQLAFAESWCCEAGPVGQQGCEGDFAIGDPAQKPAGFRRRKTMLRSARLMLILAFLRIILVEFLDT